MLRFQRRPQLLPGRRYFGLLLFANLYFDFRES